LKEAGNGTVTLLAVRRGLASEALYRRNFQIRETGMIGGWPTSRHLADGRRGRAG